MSALFNFLLITVQAAGAIALLVDVVLIVMVMRGYDLHIRYIKDEDEDE